MEFRATSWARVLVAVFDCPAPEVPMVCVRLVELSRFNVAVEVTVYSGVDDAEALTPRLVAEPTWKLLLVPIELLN